MATATKQRWPVNRAFVCNILLTMISEDNWPLNKDCNVIIWPWCFIFCRYIFKNKKKAGLQELGPRFTLKLRSLQRGSFDSKFGEYEWVHKVCSIELLLLCITLRLCSHLCVPEYDSHWLLMWTHHSFKNPHQNLGTVYAILCWCKGTTPPPLPGAPVSRHQVWTQSENKLYMFCAPWSLYAQFPLLSRVLPERGLLSQREAGNQVYDYYNYSKCSCNR